MQFLLETSGQEAPQWLQQRPGMADGAGSSPHHSLWGAGGVGERGSAFPPGGQWRRGWPCTWGSPGHRAGSHRGTEDWERCTDRARGSQWPRAQASWQEGPLGPAGPWGVGREVQPSVQPPSKMLFLKWSAGQRAAREWPHLPEEGALLDPPPPPPRSLPLRATLPHTLLILCLFQSLAEPRMGVGMEDSARRAVVGGTVPGGPGPTGKVCAVAMDVWG